MDSVLRLALSGVPHERAESLEGPVERRRILFALSAGGDGVNAGYTALLRRLRRGYVTLEGCVGGLIVDGESELYTKSMATEMVFAANRAGCAFVGRPLVEATGSLSNFTVLARLGSLNLLEAYRESAGQLIGRILSFAPPRQSHPELLTLHASSHKTSNTVALWESLKGRLGEKMAWKEVGLRNGSVVDCSGCPYTMCLHFGERGGCFYGGVMVEEVYPALRRADALVMLCPNYNDALSANLTASINRMTALYRTVQFYDKALYAVVVSGYSGGDIVARQLISALCMNKSFYLPPRFALLETANDAGTALSLPGIERRLDGFAEGMAAQLLP
ncbi:NAD(P)H-dependent oxidoreductase [Oscillibacter sp. MSJ-2]|uniref:NAD(P)H-dependent oxidoreductase n=2 Tax=Dysosmobacter acutus TaxID=2841504 RepID=A0ABS6FEN2_9FIRM|nr:NAD(P)H-dependent oxidoreductase [Dysosmobacter acutus]MBU5628091.1 NAD(P)H-dependent oxidoreductase [Dysosmobacter acutus]